MLEIKNVSKSFPGVKALNNVSVQFQNGEIHALLGENGAGKSTLMKIICGIYKADEGNILMDGNELHLSGYGDAVRHGISMVHQEIQMIPESSIAENIVNDKMSQFAKMGFVNWKKIYEFAEIYMKEVGLEFPPEKKVRFLSAAHKQLIQIAKALSADTKILLLDEPTSSLTRHEANLLFELVKKLRDKGLVIIFVSHKLEEVQLIADKVTVFRDGELVGTGEISKMDNPTIIKMMIGREFAYQYRGALNAEKNEVIFEAKHIYSHLHGLQDMSFQLRRGEILGFYGLVGSGRTELIRTILNIDKRDAGDIFLRGEKIEIDSFKTALHGLKDRRYQGTIILKIYRNEQDKNELNIWLIDDGIGIPDDKMAELNAYNAKDSEALYRVQTRTEGDRTHLGVINVISRLKLYYQENAEVIYMRNETGGTTVKIKIKTASEET